MTLVSRYPFSQLSISQLSICIGPGCGSRKSGICAWNTHIWLFNVWPNWVVITSWWTRSCWSCFSSCTSASSPSSLSSDQIGLLSWLPDSHHSCNRESNFVNSLRTIGGSGFCETYVAREDEGCWTCEKLSPSGGENRLATMEALWVVDGLWMKLWIVKAAEWECLGAGTTTTKTTIYCTNGKKQN